jgi:TonB family protein
MKLNHALRTVIVPAVLLLVTAIAAAQHEPAHNPPDHNRGVELYREGKYAEASNLLKKVVKANKSDDEAWYYIGLALIHQKKLKDATKAFETALNLRPASAESHAGLSYALLLRNNLDRALREAQAALAIDPKLVDAHYVAGVAYLRLGQREGALLNAENVLRLDPKFANAYLLKSQALVSFYGNVVIEDEKGEAREARYSQAKEALEKYLELNPNDPNNEIWTDQLESLRFWGARKSGVDRLAYSGREVTTKVRVLSKPEPGYTNAARSNQVTGIVILRAVFAGDGKVKYLMVVNGLPNGLTEAAMAAARRIKFVPATLEGRPVSMYMQLEYNFNLY